MTATTGSASAEWKAHWPLVLAATAGFSLNSLVPYSMTVFIQPIGADLGWTRAQIAAGFSLTAILTVPLSPIAGALIDRWGARRLAVPGIALTGLSIASFGLATGSIVQWLALWAIFALVSLGVSMTVWTAAVSSAFSAARGMALAVTLAGTALNQVVAPPLAYLLIEKFGWRHAYMLLSVGWALPVLVLVFLFFHDVRDPGRRGRAGNAGQHSVDADLTGLSTKEALRSASIWKIGISTFLTIALGLGAMVHQVPILTEAGVLRRDAALLASLTGVAGITGKIVTGWLMDRMHAVRISGVTLGMAAVAFTMLLESFRHPVTIVIAMIIIGYSNGAKLQISAYLVTRYGGLRNYGKIFGGIAALIAVGGAIGPLGAGLIYDISGSYTPFLILGIPGSLICGILIFGLGPYPSHEVGRPVPA